MLWIYVFLKFDFHRIFALIYADFFAVLLRMSPENTQILLDIIYIPQKGASPFFFKKADNQRTISESTTAAQNEEAVLVSRTRDGQTH